MDIADLKLIRLNPDIKQKSFVSLDSDLNDFLANDALNYSNQLLAVTYILETELDTVAFFSLLNDKISIKEQGRSWRERFNKKFPHRKRINNYPAVKIGRLAVSQNYANCGMGSQILEFIKALFTVNNRTGCRFITVDAYRAALPFYEKNGFKYLTDNDKEEDTRLMYYDLKRFIEV